MANFFTNFFYAWTIFFAMLCIVVHPMLLAFHNPRKVDNLILKASKATGWKMYALWALIGGVIADNRKHWTITALELVFAVLYAGFCAHMFSEGRLFLGTCFGILAFFSLAHELRHRVAPLDMDVARAHAKAYA
jgi:hypothetical protein